MTLTQSKYPEVARSCYLVAVSAVLWGTMGTMKALWDTEGDQVNFQAHPEVEMKQACTTAWLISMATGRTVPHSGLTSPSLWIRLSPMLVP